MRERRKKIEWLERGTKIAEPKFKGDTSRLTSCLPVWQTSSSSRAAQCHTLPCSLLKIAINVAESQVSNHNRNNAKLYLSEDNRPENKSALF